MAQVLSDLLRIKSVYYSGNVYTPQSTMKPKMLEKVDESKSPSTSTSNTSLIMVNDPDPIIYSWSNVNVFFRRKAKTSRFLGRGNSTDTTPRVIHILKNVKGICRPGELLAIMGASGAGKTTLLNVLTHRNNDKLRVTGDISINGIRVDPEAITSRSAYVQQDNLFIGSLTVREQLTFQAMLRMDRYLSYEERVRRVNQVIMELGLTKCENTLIGVPGTKKSISGGEMKRLSFGCEVLTNPSLMFCDEPTSGLDSFMAQNVIAMMKSMAERGKTIISTIHQPSSDIYSMFDRLLLMAEGRVAFLGTTDEALKFFNNLNLRCPEQYNPSDFFIDQLSVEPSKVMESRHKIAMICDNYDASDHGITDQRKQQQQTTTTTKKNTSPYKASWGTQFRVVLWRSWLEVLRDPFLIRIRFLQLVTLALLVGLLYRDQQMDELGVFNINGALMLLLTNMTYQNCNTVVNTFCSQKELFKREHHNGMYRVDVYFLAKNLVETPFFTVYAIIYTTIIYFLIGLNPSLERFLLCAMVAVMVTWCAVSFGYLLSCLAPSDNVALALLAPCTLPLLIFSGFFINVRSTPVFMKTFQYLSWFSYGNELLVVNQWSGVNNLTCTVSASCYLDGEAVIQRLGFSEDHFAFNLTCLALLIVGYRLLAFLFLLLGTNRGKPRS
ncbi:white-like 1 [Homarus americanus]|uniref:Protein white n=1 Tax=Homarus americanus TaxID=6706 RepID=A0A8J5JYC1_HOMAM|nr:white-like 1 [Homarus americanus]